MFLISSTNYPLRYMYSFFIHKLIIELPYHIPTHRLMNSRNNVQQLKQGRIITQRISYLNDQPWLSGFHIISCLHCFHISLSFHHQVSWAISSTYPGYASPASMSPIGGSIHPRVFGTPCVPCQHHINWRICSCLLCRSIIRSCSFQISVNNQPFYHVCHLTGPCISFHSNITPIFLLCHTESTSVKVINQNTKIS